MTAKRHKHDFHALWWHFGPFGRKDVHVHDCFADDCDRVVVGSGRNCNDDSDHHRETLGVKGCSV